MKHAFSHYFSSVLFLHAFKLHELRVKETRIDTVCIYSWGIANQKKMISCTSTYVYTYVKETAEMTEKMESHELKKEEEKIGG